MIAAIQVCAYYRNIREKSMNIPGGGSGLYTEDEHKNLVALERNLRLTQTYLFKGTKEQAAVGENDRVHLYDIVIGAKQLMAQKAKLKKEKGGKE